MGNQLEGKIVVVLGATGNVGAGVTAAALEEGAQVIISSRSTDGVEALKADFRGKNVEVLQGDVSDADGARALAAKVPQADHVVTSIGGWWMKPGLLEHQPAGDWAEVRRMLLDSHVYAASAFLPVVRPSGSYTVITGAGALKPMPSAHLLTVSLGGTLALSRVLRFEHREGGCRVNEVRIATRIEKLARPGVVLSLDFGRAVVRLLTSDVRSAIVPFTRPETFDVSVHLPDGQP
jgi:NAD(P)-dependent dehydrogenase (short-subunit alcohol dehydrogenase family)